MDWDLNIWQFLLAYVGGLVTPFVVWYVWTWVFPYMGR